jgi:hypothetical protein
MTVEGKKRERKKEETGQRESEEEGSTRPVATSSSPAAEAVARAHRESERAREIRRHDDTIHKDITRALYVANTRDKQNQ